jgi:hypothetical protein
MVSQYVSHREAYYSPTAERLGISNTPTEEQEALVRWVAVEFFDPLRIKIGKPLYISSFFRTPALNQAVGGAPASDHQAFGDTAALDIDNDGKNTISNAEVFFVVYNEMSYYKLIWEFGTVHGPAWVHVAYSTDPAKNEKKYTYRAKRLKNKIVYEKWQR